MDKKDGKSVSIMSPDTAQGKSDRWDTDELAAFRSQWKEELGLEDSSKKRKDQQLSDVRTEGDQSPALSTKSDSSHEPSPVKKTGDSKDPKQEAIALFKMGVAAEQSGDMSGAVKYYRQALQLDPDVEFRYDQAVINNASRAEEEMDEYYSNDDDDDDLASRLARDMESLSIKEWCTPQRQTQGGHISNLPVEVLRYIFRWVVSSLLDMRALEHVSMVCRGFYILAREPYLWQAACRRLWSGESCQLGSYGSWRRMYIFRPHLHFNGVYISKMSYVREGEHSLDGFYRPYHTVTYYRYLHFFSDGDVMYRTTPDEPAATVSSLCHKHSTESILLGRYSVSDRTVLIDLVSDNRHGQVQQYHKGRGRHKQATPTQEYRFHMELKMKKRLKQLTWVTHSCTTIHIPTGKQQVEEFSINYMYTPFYFSRVKSYSHSSNSLL